MYIQFIFLQILLFHHTSSQEKSAWTVIEEIEALAKKGAKRAESLFQDSCSETVRQCPDKTYDVCSQIIPNGMESSHTQIKIDSCKYNGIYVNYNTPGGRCANSESCSSDFDLRVICSQGTLFDDYTEQIQGKPVKTSLKQNKTSNIIYSYIGFKNSYFIQYPFKHDAFICGDCKNYDPRARSWYVSGLTGAKNLILILDISGSMTGKISGVKKVAKQIVDTLAISDQFQIVLFNDDAFTINGKDILLQGTKENKNQISDLIDKIKEEKGTNFEAAFNKAFDVFDTTKRYNQLDSNCLNIIQFMTDGVISEGESNKLILLNNIQKRNKVHKAFIFTYSLGSEADIDTLNQISCENNGIWYKASTDSHSEQSLETTMMSYYNYLASGIKLNKVVWSEIYDSASLPNQQMITATMPIFYNEQDKENRQLLGVYGIDVLINQMKTEYKDFESVVLPALQNRGRSICGDINLTDCFIERMRLKKCFPAKTCPVTNKIEVEKMCGDLTMESYSWEKDEDAEENEYASICEGSSSEDFEFCWQWWHWALMGVGILLILLSLSYLIRYLVREKKKNTKREIEYGLGEREDK